MKIPRSVRVLFEVQHEINLRLKNLVDNKFLSIKGERWHYESRLKGEESFALKVESGRVENPAKLEDFFACTVVVANSKEIIDAEKLVGNHFEIKERKPRDSSLTHKDAYSFQFDDLRLYATLKDEPSSPPRGELEGVIFEIQIKTFLQHAWSIATHDLIYKTDDVVWSKQRIAFQIKAMLEHAEVSIMEAEQLANCNAIAINNKNSIEIKNIISLIKSFWNDEDLPTDLKRLAENIYTLMKAIKLSNNELREILSYEKENREGRLKQNLSPYGVVLEALLHENKKRLLNLILTKPRNNGDKFKVIIIPEVELPKDFSRADSKRVIFID